MAKKRPPPKPRETFPEHEQTEGYKRRREQFEEVQDANESANLQTKALYKTRERALERQENLIKLRRKQRRP
jgi:hypothetical protein